MKKTASIFLLLLASVVLGVSAARLRLGLNPLGARASSPYIPVSGFKVGTIPPPIDSLDLKGQAQSLKRYRGKVLLLDFWATWCAPCVRQMPSLKQTYSKYHDQGFEIVGISEDTDKQELTSFVTDNHIPWPQIYQFDETLSSSENVKSSFPISNRYETQYVPFPVLIGRDGKIAAIGFENLYDETQLEAAIQAALG